MVHTLNEVILPLGFNVTLPAGIGIATQTPEVATSTATSGPPTAAVPMATSAPSGVAVVQECSTIGMYLQRDLLLWLMLML